MHHLKLMLWLLIISWEMGSRQNVVRALPQFLLHCFLYTSQVQSPFSALRLLISAKFPFLVSWASSHFPVWWHLAHFKHSRLMTQCREYWKPIHNTDLIQSDKGTAIIASFEHILLHFPSHETLQCRTRPESAELQALMWGNRRDLEKTAGYIVVTAILWDTNIPIFNYSRCRLCLPLPCLGSMFTLYSFVNEILPLLQPCGPCPSTFFFLNSWVDLLHFEGILMLLSWCVILNENDPQNLDIIHVILKVVSINIHLLSTFLIHHILGI